MLTVSPVRPCVCVRVAAGGLSPTVPSAELTLLQQRLDLPPLGVQAGTLCGRAAAVGRHDANQSHINVGTAGYLKGRWETRDGVWGTALIGR